MPTGYQIEDQSNAYYVTFQVVKWEDIFTRKLYSDIVIESLKYCQENKGLEIYAYVIMSNHIHLILRSGSGDLSGTIRDMKKFTSKKIIQALKDNPESRKEWLLNIFQNEAGKHKRNTEYQLWTHENHAIELHSEKFIKEKTEYIHHNPVRSGIVLNPEDYLYSSARNYAGLNNVMQVELLTFKWTTYV